MKNNKMEVNKIYQGDCLEIMKEFPSKSIDMILTDIPYGEINRKSNGLRILNKGIANIVDFSIEKMINEFCRLTKGSIYIFCGTSQVSEIRSRLIMNELSTRLLIWNKTNPSPMNGQYIWLSSIECCVYGKFKNAVFNEYCRDAVLNFPSGRSKIHPTEKPVEMFEYLIKVSSNENDLILDPFAGSGTTGVACKKLNRNYILIEKEPKYVEVAKQRINSVSKLLFNTI